MNFDDELQEKIESGHPLRGKDAEAYRKVFSALKKEPPGHLSETFTDAVIKRVEQRHASTSYRVEIGVWLCSVLLLILAGAYAIAVTNISFSLGFLSGLKPYFGLFAFGGISVFIFQYFEKRLLGKRAM